MKLFLAILTVIALHLPTVAFGHSLMCPKPAVNPNDNAARVAACAMSTIKPRDAEHSRKAEPCGGLARNANQPVNNYTPGQVVSLKLWNSIVHPGSWRVEFSNDNDTTFTLLTTINKPGNTNEVTANVTMPTTPCQNCTIRLVEIMTENPAAPSYYRYCANINIGAASNNNTSGNNTTGANNSGANTSGTNTSGTNNGTTLGGSDLPCSP